MKIVFFGDSITDGCRNRERDDLTVSYGAGFVLLVASELLSENPHKYTIYNRGIGGHRSVDLYARMKKDVWEMSPDIVNILVGINDIWHEQMFANGLDVTQYENIYRLMIQDTKQRLPNTKIIVNEPFVLPGRVTQEDFPVYEKIYEYAKVVKRLAEEYGLYYLPLQEKISCLAERYGNEKVLFDGIHPTPLAVKALASEWLKLFKKIEKET